MVALNLFAASVAVATLSIPAMGQFARVRESWPPAATHYPEPPQDPPTGSGLVTHDAYDNFWALDRSGSLWVLPAQDVNNASPWRRDTISGLPPDQWQFLQCDEHGFLWIASRSRILRLDPRAPETGWIDFTAGLGPQPNIRAMALAPSGSVLVALDEGVLVELDYIDQLSTLRTPAPRHAEHLATDDWGRIWLRTSAAVWRKDAPAGAWQRHWRLAARLPGGNHDLSGETLNQSFYMAGGQTAAWGYPARPHIFDGIYEFDGDHWRTRRRLLKPRYYNGTAALSGRVWIIGGSERDEYWKAKALDTVEIYDPESNSLSPGPALPEALDMAVAAHLGNRLYVAGGGHLYSIDGNEQAWRREPDLPPSAGLKAFAGATLGQHWFLTIPKLGLARFDSKVWSVALRSYQPRSPQVAAYQGKIWMMGGRELPTGTRTVIFDPITGSVIDGPELPRELSWGAASEVGGRLMVTGGAAGRCYNDRTFLLRQTSGAIPASSRLYD